MNLRESRKNKVNSSLKMKLKDFKKKMNDFKNFVIRKKIRSSCYRRNLKRKTSKHCSALQRNQNSQVQ